MSSTDFKEITFNGAFFVKDGDICVNMRDDDVCMVYYFEAKNRFDYPDKHMRMYLKFVYDTQEYSTSGGLYCSVSYSATLPSPVGNLCKVAITIDELDVCAIFTLRITKIIELSPDQYDRCFPWKCHH